MPMRTRPRRGPSNRLLTLTSAACCKQTRLPPFAGYGRSESRHRVKGPNRLGQSFYWRRLRMCGKFPGIWLQEFELGAVARWEVLLGDVFFTPAFCLLQWRSTRSEEHTSELQSLA